MLLDAFESLCHIYLHCNNLCLIELHHVVKLEPSRIFYNDLLQIVLNQPICSMHATANEEAWILAGDEVSVSDWQGQKPETLPRLKTTETYRNWLSFISNENTCCYNL